jgi:hypothetical protein
MPYVDHPLPEDFYVSVIAPPKHKVKYDPPTKQKGAVAKLTRDVKAGILNGAIAHGADGEGLGGLDGYFFMCASKYPKHYMHLLGKLMPMQVQGDGVVRPGVTLNIVSIPHDNYLSLEDIERLKSPGAVIEQPLQQAAPELAPTEAPIEETAPQMSEEQELQLINQLQREIHELAQKAGISLVQHQQ